MEFKKATKRQAKLRLALCGLAGSGKTYSSLSIASTISAEMRRLGHGEGKIALLDTEHESASLYADRFDFDAAGLDNHSPRAYVDAIRSAEAAGYDVLVIDSLSHAWAGKNGALEQKDNAALRSGNSFTAWRDITPMHNALVDGMLGSRMHVIATMRTKMEYAQNVVNGKTVIEKIGLAAIQREGMEYEFTIVGDIDLQNVMRVSKTRLAGVLSPGEAFERPGEFFAKKVYGWLMDGVPMAPVVTPPREDPRAILAEISEAPSVDALAALVPRIKTLDTRLMDQARQLYSERKAELMESAEISQEAS